MAGTSAFALPRPQQPRGHLALHGILAPQLLKRNAASPMIVSGSGSATVERRPYTDQRTGGRLPAQVDYEPPAGPISNGRCSRCRATREFFNDPDMARRDQVAAVNDS